MSPKKTWFYKVSIAAVVFGIAMISSVGLIYAQSASENSAEAPNERQGGGVPEDWSHHHLIFSSNPGTFDDAQKTGSFDKWYRIVSDPRFNMQRLKRTRVNPAAQVSTGAEVETAAEDMLETEGAANFIEIGPATTRTKTPGPTLKRDWSQTLGGAGVATNMYPTKWQFSTTGSPSCSDYVVFGVNKAGASGSQPNIVGLKNLYNTTCSSVPTVLFSYYVGTGTVQTSPVLGFSSGEVAYVESVSGGSKFHVLTGAGTGASNGTIAAPVVPGTGNTASDASLVMHGGVSVTRSSPFYDYAHDTAYVGDDSGNLHKFTPVFGGTLTEVISSGANVWPAAISSSTLTGPVYDSVSGKVFVGDAGGYLYSVSPTIGSGSGGSIKSGQLGSGTGIVEAPIVDSTNGLVYVFVGQDAGSTGNGAVFKLAVGFAATTTGSHALVGTGSAAISLYAGDFDNGYYTSETGNLYVCGYNGSGYPTLYGVAISSGTLGAVTAGPLLASSNTAVCSPLTEFYNTTTSTDWLFAGVSGTSCGGTTGQGGCVMSFNIAAAPTIGPWTPSTSFALNAEVVDTSGRIQKCTGGACGGAAGNISGTATPSWTATTTTEALPAATNASSTGTVSANSAVSGATVTIGTLTLTASAPTSASSPILINATPTLGDTLTINGIVYDFHTNAIGCVASPQKCVAISGTTTTATNLNSAIAGTCFNGACAVDPTVTATLSSATVTITAITKGTGANADALATSDSTNIHINGAANASTTLGAGTGTLGTNGSSTAPNFQYWSGAAVVSTATLASNIAAAAAGNSANVTLTYTSGSSFTASGTGTNAGVAGNSVAIGGTLTGFSWSPTGFLAGGISPLTWTYQSASNGQTTAAQATGVSGIIIDNIGAVGSNVANIYFGTLGGTGAANDGVKMTQSGLN